MSRPAAFLDRDGTIIKEREYLADPAGVELIDGVVDALRLLAASGYALVVVTNQSGIARGLYTEAQFRAVQERLESILGGAGVHLDGVYHCPHHPDVAGPCACRKPGLGMYRDAARQLDLDVSVSLYIGDRLRDVLPARALGGRGFLVRTGYGADEAAAAPAEVEVVDDLRQAVHLALQRTR
ncbi:MAG TPA: HAD family hydrolase [Longimicrobiales bacterium]|nr:HAD family hydrolase [Longimicrobiales bacterium]